MAGVNHGQVSDSVYHAFQNNTIRLINGPISRILDNKLNLALLSLYQDDDLFTPQEQEIIRKYIPWTRKVTPQNTTFYDRQVPDLETFILENREKMVLKAAVGYGGTGVFIGPKTSPQIWQDVVKKAFVEGAWIIQEYVPAIPGTYQSGAASSESHDISFGFFIFGSLYGGTWIRVMPQQDNKGIINCHQGASVSVVFDVDN